MSRRRWPGRGDDRGSFTAELAAGLPALVLLLLAGLTAVTAVTTKGQCVDTARDAALAAARGEAVDARARRTGGAQVTVVTDGDTVTATVVAPVRALGARLPPHDCAGHRRRRGRAGRLGRRAVSGAGAGGRRRGRPGDRGAASLWVLAIGLVLVFAGVAGAAVGVAWVGRHRAQAAADLGALAGAVRVLDGQEVACARAGELVAANGGRLTACAVDGLDLVVTVAVPVTPLPRMRRVAEASARAGPVRVIAGVAG